MNIVVWMLIAFGIGFSLGIAIDRVGLWVRNLTQRSGGGQAPSQKPTDSDSEPFLPPFPRLRPPPR